MIEKPASAGAFLPPVFSGNDAKKRIVGAADALLTALARSNPEAAKSLREERQRMTDSLREMEQAKKSIMAQRKEAARQKIARLKMQLSALRLMVSANPGGAARQVARLAKELAQAVREYARAGGTATGGQMPQAGILSSATKAASAKEATGETAAATGNPSGSEAASAIRGEEAESPWQRRREDADFVKSAREVAQMLKNVMRMIQRELRDKEDQNAADSLEAAVSELKDAGKISRKIMEAANAGLRGADMPPLSPQSLNLLA